MFIQTRYEILLSLYFKSLLLQFVRPILSTQQQKPLTHSPMAISDWPSLLMFTLIGLLNSTHSQPDSTCFKYSLTHTNWFIGAKHDMRETSLRICKFVPSQILQVLIPILSTHSKLTLTYSPYIICLRLAKYLNGSHSKLAHAFHHWSHFNWFTLCCLLSQTAFHTGLTLTFALITHSLIQYSLTLVYCTYKLIHAEETSFRICKFAQQLSLT